MKSCRDAKAHLYTLLCKNQRCFVQSFSRPRYNASLHFAAP